MTAESDIGRKVRQIRHARGKSLAVIAGLAGISAPYLSMIERGERAVDRRSLIVALANALEVAPADLVALPFPAPGDGNTDLAVTAVRQALMAVIRDQPGGQVLPVDALRERVGAVQEAGCRCEHEVVAATLPALIRDVHTSIAAGRDVAQLLDLAVILNTRAATSWLRIAGASVELRSLATLLARKAAERRESVTAMGLAAWGDALVLLAAGDFGLAAAELDAVTVPTTDQNSTEMAGMLALCSSLVAAADQRQTDVDAALDHARDLAEHTGEGNAWWLGFGPTNVGLWRMTASVETGDHDRTVALAEGLNPEVHPARSRQAAYWIDYGRALARTRGRRDDAVRALRRAEDISPLHTRRNPFVREVVGELLVRAKRDAVGRELRGMAHRTGLPT